MIKIKVQPYAEAFLKDIFVDVEDWVEKQEEPVRRKIVTQIICDHLNKHRYNGKSGWVPGRCFNKLDNTARYTTPDRYPYVSIITCKYVR